MLPMIAKINPVGGTSALVVNHAYGWQDVKLLKVPPKISMLVTYSIMQDIRSTDYKISI